jgi:hypothetical protein
VLKSKVSKAIFENHTYSQASCNFAARNRDYPVVYVHEMHAREVYAYEVPAHEVYIHEMHALEMYARKILGKPPGLSPYKR